MPKIVGYVGDTAPPEEPSFPWLGAGATVFGALGALWVASKLPNWRRSLVANPLSEYQDPTLSKIEAAVKKARTGEPRYPVPESVREALKKLPPGRYTYDLGEGYPSRMRKTKPRQRVRRYRQKTTRRGANYSASKAAQETDSPHIVVETFGKDDGPVGAEYEASEFVTLAVYREDGRPEFLIHADKVEQSPLPTAEERKANLAALKQKRIDSERLKQEALARKALLLTARTELEMKKIADRIALDEAAREVRARRDTSKREERVRRIVEKQIFGGLASEIKRARKDTAKQLGASFAAEEAKRAAARAAAEAATAAAAAAAAATPAAAGAPAKPARRAPTAQELRQEATAAGRRAAATPASGNYVLVAKAGEFVAAIDARGNKRLLLAEPFAGTNADLGSFVTVTTPVVTSAKYGKTFGVKLAKKADKPTPAQKKAAEKELGTTIESEAELPPPPQRQRAAPVPDEEAEAPAPTAKPKTSRKAPAKAAPAKAAPVKAPPAKAKPAKAAPAKPAPEPAPEATRAVPQKAVRQELVVPGLYFYIDSVNGRARTVSSEGKVVLFSEGPFELAKAKENSLVSVRMSTRASVPFIVEKAPPKSKLTADQEERVFRIVAGEDAGAPAPAPAPVKEKRRAAKTSVSKRSQEQIEDAESEGFFEPSLDEPVEEFEEEDEEGGSLFAKRSGSEREGRRPKTSRAKAAREPAAKKQAGTPAAPAAPAAPEYGTVGRTMLPGEVAAALYAGILGREGGMVEDGTSIIATGRIVGVPSAATQRRRAGVFTVQIESKVLEEVPGQEEPVVRVIKKKIDIPVPWIGAVGDIEPGDQLNLIAQVGNGKLVGMAADVSRLGFKASAPSAPQARAERAEPSAKAERPEKPAKPAKVASPPQKQRTSRPAGPSEEQRRIMAMSQAERVLRNRITVDWVRRQIDWAIPERLKQVRIKEPETKLMDMGVTTTPGQGKNGEFSFTGFVKSVPTEEGKRTGVGLVEVQWSFARATIPFAAFGSRDVKLNDWVTMSGVVQGRDLRDFKLTRQAAEPEPASAPESQATTSRGAAMKSTGTTSRAKAQGAAKQTSRRGLKKNSRASKKDPSLFREFRRTINMSSDAILRWRRNPQHRHASLPHIRAELPLLAKMKRTPMSKWTPQMWNKAMRAINFVKRHEAQMKVQGKRYGTGRFHATYKRIIGLLNWGRKTPGVNIKSVLAKKTSKRRVTRNPEADSHAMPYATPRLYVMRWPG